MCGSAETQVVCIRNGRSEEATDGGPRVPWSVTPFSVEVHAFALMESHYLCGAPFSAERWVRGEP